ncbi:hypothetical protein CBF34_04700 [Vagococcus penaei]|uniref:Serine aminopeptidase S33 domain-containing protein n=1 Tax=Vagococcus penaei TaxID=633807 RepID=A0A1Q2D4L9_9ENTE|nr:alpha/beta fold hydrolase [Vagococcus penaei]AQP53323.1 hypothetical protein BW732_03125 [Vagococcus penaei]RSU04094.1 hypothetical protein CBF34_04700 [Vagococcus penaei]
MENTHIYLKNGPQAILLLHAYTGSPNDVGLLARRLGRDGYTVLAPLFSGHGTFDPIDILDEGPDVWWEDAKKAMDFLRKEGYEHLLVFGLSLGGIYAIRLLETYPDYFIGGGSFSSPLIASKNHEIYPNFLRYCEYLYKKNGIVGESLDKKLATLNEPLKKQLADIATMTEYVSNHLYKIDVPVFLGQSGLDEMIDATSVYEAASKLSAINHEVHWYANSTHVLTISKDRQEFEQDVCQFIKKLV